MLSLHCVAERTDLNNNLKETETLASRKELNSSIIHCYSTVGTGTTFKSQVETDSRQKARCVLPWVCLRAWPPFPLPVPTMNTGAFEAINIPWGSLTGA